MCESCAPLPKRKPTIKRPAASTSVPKRGRRQATKVESASCRGFHISARPAGPPGTWASAVAPLQRGSGTAGQRDSGFLPPTPRLSVTVGEKAARLARDSFLRPRIVVAYSEPISFGRFYEVQTLIIQHPEAVRLWLVYFFACVYTTIKTFLKKIKA